MTGQSINYSRVTGANLSPGNIILHQGQHLMVEENSGRNCVRQGDKLAPLEPNELYALVDNPEALLEPVPRPNSSSRRGFVWKLRKAFKVCERK